jgi:hypothetical protein
MFHIPTTTKLPMLNKQNKNDEQKTELSLSVYLLVYILPMFFHVMNNVHQPLIDELLPLQLNQLFLHMNEPNYTRKLSNI